MKSEEWKSYRTRFLVNAKQLSSNLSFVDHLGRQHCGRKGDYLVESSDGVISIAPRRIFEDIYVPMSQAHDADHPDGLRDPEKMICATTMSGREIDLQGFEALEIQEIRLRKSSTSRQRLSATQGLGPDQAARGPRKLPQPWRDRRSSSNRIGLM
ncbi:MAG: hypothetical protein WB781_27980 [Candidatus Sulfotelmatobacter sp.]